MYYKFDYIKKYSIKRCNLKTPIYNRIEWKISITVLKFTN